MPVTWCLWRFFVRWCMNQYIYGMWEDACHVCHMCNSLSSIRLMKVTLTHTLFKHEPHTCVKVTMDHMCGMWVGGYCVWVSLDLDCWILDLMIGIYKLLVSIAHRKPTINIMLETLWGNSATKIYLVRKKRKYKSARTATIVSLEASKFPPNHNM